MNDGFEPKSLLVTNPGISSKDLHALSKQEAALEAWMREVTALLCYQPEVPMTHKVDLSNAMQSYRVASGRTPKPGESND